MKDRLEGRKITLRRVGDEDLFAPPPPPPDGQRTLLNSTARHAGWGAQPQLAPQQRPQSQEEGLVDGEDDDVDGD